ncbi:hypothetical protein [Ralstonia solanacearum]|uniref:hypothetical protein n=1 Tax=Ralstonia solanacearum TaxID=305 RepID=UPI0013DDF96D|nr:hypothetical protein [Ralstonia solanacearum]
MARIEHHKYSIEEAFRECFTVEIQARFLTGFNDGLQRAVKDCNVLKFKSAEFEAGE